MCMDVKLACACEKACYENTCTTYFLLEDRGALPVFLSLTRTSTDEEIISKFYVKGEKPVNGSFSLHLLLQNSAVLYRQFYMKF